MRTTFLNGSALACALLASTLAYAADLPARVAPDIAPLPPLVPSFSWTGLYIGGNAGYGFGLGRDRTNETVTFPANANDPSGGFTTSNPLLAGTGTPVNVLNLPTTLTLPTQSDQRSAVAGGGGPTTTQSGVSSDIRN